MSRSSRQTSTDMEFHPSKPDCAMTDGSQVLRSQHWINCPQCGSHDLRIVPYDYGMCSQTGYNDAGERWECKSCGSTGYEEEL